MYVNSKGIVLLAMTTLSYERDYDVSITQLKVVQNLNNSNLDIIVAAYEAEAGVQLKFKKDDITSFVADKCMTLLKEEIS